MHQLLYWQKHQWVNNTLLLSGLFLSVVTQETNDQPDSEEGIILNGTYNGG